MFIKFMLLGACWLLLVSCTSLIVFAQHGGKAEPLRIEFKKGTSSITISEKVKGSISSHLFTFSI